MPNQVWDDAQKFLEIAYGFTREPPNRVRDEVGLTLIRSVRAAMERFEEERRTEERRRMIVLELEPTLAAVYRGVCEAGKWLNEHRTAVRRLRPQVAYLIGRRLDSSFVTQAVNSLMQEPRDLKPKCLKGERPRSAQDAARENLGQLMEKHRLSGFQPTTLRETKRSLVDTSQERRIRECAPLESWAALDLDDFHRQVTKYTAPIDPETARDS